MDIKRKIIRGIPNVSFMPLKDMGLENSKIHRVWTIVNEAEMFSGEKFDDQTGERILNALPRTLDNPKLIHGVTVFLEDRLHDWEIYGDKFKIFTRIVDKDEKIDLLIEYTE